MKRIWNRVNRQNPCPVCGKNDWCLVSLDESAVICPRTERGAIKRIGEAGWLHVLQDFQKGRSCQKVFSRSITCPMQGDRWELRARQCEKQLSRQNLYRLAVSLVLKPA